MKTLRHLGVVVTALVLGACGGCGEDAPTGPPPRARQAFHFRLAGPAPWNRTVHYATAERVGSSEPYDAAILGDDGSFVVSGYEGDAYQIRAERAPSPAEARMLWDFDHRGTLGAGVLQDPAAVVQVETVARAAIDVIAPGSKAGPDVVTLYVDDDRVAACAIRDDQKGLDLAMWALGDRENGNSYRTAAPGRPWRLDEFAPGPCVLAARTKGHLWTALRVDLSPGARVTIDVGTQPSADTGGSVVCEDPYALLLLGGDLPVPAPRKTTRLHFRSLWNGVPAGEHTVRYADGRAVAITVERGQEVRLGR